MGYFEILFGLAAVILGIYYYLSSYEFWKSRGVPGPQPTFPFGNFKDVMLAKEDLSTFTLRLYKKYKDEPMIGIFTRRMPILILHDTDLIKDVLIKDFSKFTERGLTISAKVEPLSQHLFNLEHKRWRVLRMKLSPVFTSGRLKDMFPLILECSNRLEQYLENLVGKNQPIECRELAAKYTTDVIGSCAFGLEINSLSDNDNEFRKRGREIFAPTWSNLLRVRFRQSMPWLSHIMGYIFPRTQLSKFFTRIIVENMDYRDKNNVARHDFVDMLRELKKQADKIDFELTDALITAQAFVFFIAGFETSSTTMSNALYELAQNQEIQNALRKEINNTYEKAGKDLTYDNIKQMNYLDKIFKETLRKYPPVMVLMRQAMSDYTFDGTKITIPKKQKIWIPIYALQRDPNIYPEPDVFDPERFNEDVVKSRNPMYYLPFGDGPRNCIGARFAIYQTKLGLVKTLQNYKIETCEKTQIPYVNDPKAFLLAPKGGIYLKISKIDRS